MDLSAEISLSSKTYYIFLLLCHQAFAGPLWQPAALKPSSLPATLPCDVDTYLEVSPRNEEQVFQFPSEPTTLRKAIDKVPPSRDQIWNYNIAPFPAALERTVRLKKGGDALGLTVDVLDTISGVVVSSLQPGSAAEKDGKIEAGDFLLSINSNPLRNVSEERVAEILLQAEKLNTDVIVKYIPAADAAFHHQSELMSLDRETEPEHQQSPSLRTISVDETFDVPDMEPPDLPPPAPPSLSSEEESSDVKKEVQKVEQSPPPIKEKVVSQVVVSASIPKPTPPKSAVPSLEIKKAILPVRSPKPAVPLKPIRTSLSPLDIPSREKSRASTLEVIISEIGSSTLSRQWGPERNVELWRDSFKGLGISIISGKVDTFQAGIFIKNVLADSPAGWNGTLKRGDRILEVGGVNLRNAAHSKAVEVIKNAQNPVKFVVQSLVPVPKKSDSDPCSVETKPPPVPQSPIPSEDQPAVPTQPQLPRPSLSEISSQIHVKVPSPVSWTPSAIPSQSPASISEGIKKAASDEKEPPLPPPRTVSRILKTPSDTAADDDDEEDDSETTDKVSSTLPQGKVLTKKGVEIDFASAGHVKLTPSEKAEDPEEDDDFGYTLKKIQKKYGDMKGELIVVDLVKGSNKLGLSLAGNKDRTKMSVFVCGMHPNGNAAKDGRIKIGDELLEVNGLIMYGRCHLNASAMIKGLSGTAYKILLLRREGAAEEMAVKPLSQFPSELDEETPEDKYCHYRGMRTVTVRKGAHGLGIMIIEGKHAEVGQGIFISDIQENSAAEQAGLTVGDMILSANETDLVGADYDTAASILKQAEGLITLIVANPNKPSPGFLYDEEMKSDEKIIDKSQERNITLKTLDKKKEKSTPPLPPPKPLHLTGKPTTHIIPTAATSLLSALGRHSVTPSLTSPQKMKLLPMPPIANIDDDVSSSQEQNEPPPDPKRCDIKPGRETTIEITKEKIGLGLSIVGGSDTPLGAIIIHEVYPDGAAALDARLKPGDQILEVNGEDLRDAPHERAITALRQTPAVVLMLVYREEIHNHEEDAHEVLEVELHKKPGRGLGLSIVGRKNGPGVFISEVVKGGVAEADGRLIQGDQIIEVNGQDLKNATQEHAAAVLKTTMGRINMKIGRLKAGSRRSTSGLATTPRLEENMDTPPECKTITLERGSDGLGFSIVGGFGSPHGNLPIYVKKVFEKGAAAEDGCLQRGDQIIAVNEQSLQGLTHENAVAILKKVTGTVTLTVLS